MSALTGSIELEIRRVLEKAPPDLAADVYTGGITMTGGGSLLRDLPSALSKRLGIEVTVAGSPKYSVAYGTGLAAQMEEQFVNCIQYDP